MRGGNIMCKGKSEREGREIQGWMEREVVEGSGRRGSYTIKFFFPQQEFPLSLRRGQWGRRLREATRASLCLFALFPCQLWTDEGATLSVSLHMNKLTFNCLLLFGEVLTMLTINKSLIGIKAFLVKFYLSASFCGIFPYVLTMWCTRDGQFVHPPRKFVSTE